MAEAIAVLKQQGAIVVDPADIPSVVDTDPKNNFLLWAICCGVDNGKGKDADCSIVFKYGMKRDFNKWLASLGPAAPVEDADRAARSGTSRTPERGAIKYGQAQPRHLGRDGSRERSRALRGRPGQGHPAERRPRASTRS